MKLYKRLIVVGKWVAKKSWSLLRFFFVYTDLSTVDLIDLWPTKEVTQAGGRERTSELGLEQECLSAR